MSIELDYQNQKIFVNGKAISDINGIIAENVPLTPRGSITATNLQAAIHQIADNYFREDGIPTGVGVEKGDFWYETDTETLYVYREVTRNVFNWVPISTGTDSSDTLDGGSY